RGGQESVEEVPFDARFVIVRADRIGPGDEARKRVVARAGDVGIREERAWRQGRGAERGIEAAVRGRFVNHADLAVPDERRGREVIGRAAGAVRYRGLVALAAHAAGDL